jgi:hypothetical protein
MTPEREQELEQLRAGMHRAVDAYIGNLLDDGAAGGLIAEGEMPDVQDALADLADTYDPDLEDTES